MEINAHWVSALLSQISKKPNFETTELSEQSNMTFLSQEAIKLLRDQMATKKAGWCLNPKNANQKANRIKQNH